MAVDVRETDPEGHYTPNIVAEFLMVPDDVQDGWILANGVWTNPPSPSVPTVDEIAAEEAEEAAAQAASKAQSDTEQAASVRASRTQKLKDCDWTQIGDSTADKAAWATYRQALRDITTQAGFPWTVEWPVQP
jgi:hypothetical protein